MSPQCPLPGAQLSRGGSLGMRRAYRPAAASLLASFTRKVVLGEVGAGSGAGGLGGPEAVTDLVLYDPELDEVYQAKLQALRMAGAAADAAAAALAAEEAGTAGGAGAEQAEALAGGQQHAAAGAAAQQAAAPPQQRPAASSGSSTGSDGESSGWVDPDATGAVPQATTRSDANAGDSMACGGTAAATPQGRLAAARDAAQKAAAAAAEAARAAGPARAKVHADAFLVEKLRPHQREGVRFVFTCLSGVIKDGVSGAVLADGMGERHEAQTPSPPCHPSARMPARRWCHAPPRALTNSPQSFAPTPPCMPRSPHPPCTPAHWGRMTTAGLGKSFQTVRGGCGTHGAKRDARVACVQADLCAGRCLA